MNVLIVDDQASVVSSLKSGIHWNAVEIYNIYTALNAHDAKEIIKTHEIDLMLSDIEMPIENGLSLLRWCRKNNYSFECIFLTSHADFFYAQEAIQLGSFDYILQPARYEDVEKTIQKVITRIRQNQETERFTDYGKAAISQRNALLKGLLDDWLAGKTEDAEEMLESLQSLGIQLVPSSSLGLLWLDVLSWTANPLPFAKWSSEMEELLKQQFSYSNLSALSYCSDKHSMRVILYRKDQTAFTDEIIYNSLESIIQTIENTINLKLACYVAPVTVLEYLSKAAASIRKLRCAQENLIPGIYYAVSDASPSENTVQKNCYDIDQLYHFSLCLSSHQAAKAQKEAEKTIQTMKEHNQLTPQNLFSFCWDYKQAAGKAIRHLGLSSDAVDVFENIEIPGDNRSLTISKAYAFLSQITDFFQTMVPDRDSDNNSFSRITNYISENLDKPLLCSDIAKAVYLSPDYITRLFQKNMGCSLKEYVTAEKMKAARNLLISTTLPISVIAVKVGYDNFSHFSKVYKKVMEISPSTVFYVLNN